MSITFQQSEYADADRHLLLKHVTDSAQRTPDLGCGQGAFRNALKQIRDVGYGEPGLQAASAAK